MSLRYHHLGWTDGYIRGVLPHGWTAHVHPEGAIYYLHGETACPMFRARIVVLMELQKTFTEVDICNVTVLADIEQFQNTLYRELHRAIEAQLVNLDLEDVELVLEPRADDVGVLCSYYFVHRQKRCLFWLEEFDAYNVLGECKGVGALSHKSLCHWRACCAVVYTHDRACHRGTVLVCDLNKVIPCHHVLFPAYLTFSDRYI